MSNRLRSSVVDLAHKWLGMNEADGSFKKIIDIYNTQDKFPRGTKMLYNWPWCACTWSALAISLGYKDVMPVEISCYYLIEAAKRMGIWIEQDGRIPKLAEAVLYDWDDGTDYITTDNTGRPEHVGVVVEVNEAAGYFVVIEGNYKNAVKKRTLSINGRYIRGFISPKYTETGLVLTPPRQSDKDITIIAREVIAGTWGNGEARKKTLTDAGYNYNEVRAKVNEILNGGAKKPTTATNTANRSLTATDVAAGFASSIKGTYTTGANLYMRHGAGSNKKAMVVIPKGTKVKCYGYYGMHNGAKWYYVQVTLDDVKYTGFCHSGYLKK